jgi:tungstate transport system substrate-binding protein
MNMYLHLKTPALGIYLTLALASLLTTSIVHAETLRVATTHSLKSSGIFKHIIPVLEKEINAKIKVLPSSMEQAIRRAKKGQADILFSHSPGIERKFVKEGWGIARYPVMTSDLMFVGPANDPANISQAKNLSSLFMRLIQKKAPFVSRGDQSELHKKEVQLWHRHALLPTSASWYHETKSNMNKTLLKANQLNAYTLTDTASWLTSKSKLKLKPLYQRSKHLKKVFSVTLLNSERHIIQIRESSKFLDWFLSDEGKKHIANYKISNQVVFAPITKK